jgi:hypothetical protein
MQYCSMLIQLVYIVTTVFERFNELKVIFVFLYAKSQVQFEFDVNWGSKMGRQESKLNYPIIL